MSATHLRYTSFSSSSLFSIIFVLLLAAQVHRANGTGVEFINPRPGAVFPAGSFSINWGDGGGDPNITELATYTLSLVVGGNSPSDSKSLMTLGEANAPVKDLGLSTAIPADIGQSIQNGYYLCMTSININGTKQVINYSNRFTLINMNGTTDQIYISGAANNVGDNNVPPVQVNQIAPPASTASPTSTAATSSPTDSPPSSPTTIITGSPGSTYSSLPTATLAGLAVGSLVAVILFIVLITLCLIYWRKRRREQKRAKENQEMDDADKVELSVQRSSRSFTGTTPSPLCELSPEQERFEAMERDKVVEADSDIRYELEGDWAGWEAAARNSRAYDPTR